MQRWVDHVLCTLPFEATWFRRRAVNAHYIGHPYFDELSQQQLDVSFLHAQHSRPETVVAILPGSRMQELEYNLASQLRAAELLYRRVPNLRFLVAAFNSTQKDYADSLCRSKQLPIEVHVGRTPEIIQLAKVCMAVSGSVSLELLNALVPSVVNYRVHRLGWLISRTLRTCPWISLVNLLACEEVFPEYVNVGCAADAMARDLERWLTDTPSWERARTKLLHIRNRVAQPGACGRAADYIIHELRSPQRSIAGFNNGIRRRAAHWHQTEFHPGSG
jgi:lipid-A-disaccharide synthase